MLLTLGAVRSRTILGPSFYVAHVILFFVSVPALANALVLREHCEFRQRREFIASWYVAAALCTYLLFSWCYSSTVFRSRSTGSSEIAPLQPIRSA